MVHHEGFSMRILLISSDAINPQMAGPGIRYWEFARHLSKTHTVTVLTPNASTLSHPRFQLVQNTRQSLAAAISGADVIVTQGYGYPLAQVYQSRLPLVVDLYDPLPIELLEHHAHLPLLDAQLSQSYCVERAKCLMRRGDFFLYSHQLQRAYWLGMLTAMGRVQHMHYRETPDFSDVLGCVPYGISDHEPVQTRHAIRGVDAAFSEAISDTDTVLLWGGGLWNWFDPCSVIHALGDISRTRQDIKLVFLATARSNQHATQLDIAYATDQALALSRELGLYNRLVFFNESWVPYADRQNFLLDANIGVSTHFKTLETEFSFRTRILDYLWTELPILSTTGDYLSELVERHQLGITVEPQNIAQLKHAILRLADDQVFVEQCKANIREIRRHMTWSRVVMPLEAFCAAPYRTSKLTQISQTLHMFGFYVTNIRLLIQYRGHRKILAKLKQLMHKPCTTDTPIL